MAAKKYYAVKKGKVTGIFESWEDCRLSVDGYPKAEYKAFPSLREAKLYLGEAWSGPDVQEDAREDIREDARKDIKEDIRKDIREDIPGRNQSPGNVSERCRKGRLLAYVDGSYDHSLKKYAFGCVFILPDGHIFTEYGNGDNPESLKLRNVTGEMLGAMYAVRCAMAGGYAGLEIRYDYEGIEKWVTGVWRSRTELTRKYAEAMREWGKSLEVTFTKVTAHTNVYYNELADKMAKMGLVQGNGIPKVRPPEDMEEYHGTDENQ